MTTYPMSRRVRHGCTGKVFALRATTSGEPYRYAVEDRRDEEATKTRTGTER